MVIALIIFVPMVTIAWIFSLFLFYRTIKSDENHRHRVQFILTRLVYASMRIWWVEKPEEEKNERKRQEKQEKLKKEVFIMAVELLLCALAVGGIGIIALTFEDKSAASLLLAAAFPAVLLGDLYYFFLWYLLKGGRGTGR